MNHRSGLGIDVYGVVLAGDGDIYIKLLDKAAWDWLFSCKQDVPESVQSMLDEPVEDACVKPNDKALWINPKLTFYELHEFAQYLREHPEVVVVDSWVGVIY